MAAEEAILVGHEAQPLDRALIAGVNKETIGFGQGGRPQVILVPPIQAAGRVAAGTQDTIYKLI